MLLHMLFLFLAIFPTALFGEMRWKGHTEGFEASVSISSKEITLLDILEIEITVTYPSDYSIDTAALTSHLLSGFDPIATNFALVEEKINPPQSVNKNMIAQTIRYHLDPLVPGNFALSFLEIPFVPKTTENLPVQLFSDVFNILVKPTHGASKAYPRPASLLPMSPLPSIEISENNRQKLIDGAEVGATEAARNVKILQEKTFPLTGVLVSLFIFICLAIISKPLINYMVERTKKTPLTPKAKALQELEKIQKEELISKGQYEKLYIGLTDTVRKYVEEQFQIRAPHLTTQEFLKKAMQSETFDEKTKNALGEFLQRADMVKFAEFHPAQSDYEKAEKAAQDFVARHSDPPSTKGQVAKS